MEKMKQCSKCKLSLSYSEFNTDRNANDGKRSNCWICDKAMQSNGRARTMGCEGTLDGRSLRDKFEEQDICHYGWCNGSKLHRENAVIDHMDPLDGGGANTLDNIVWACKTCNEHKGKKRYDIAFREGWSRGENEVMYCPRCNNGKGALKPVSEFRITGSNKRGREGWCRECNKRRKRSSYQKNRVDKRKLSRKYDRY